MEEQILPQIAASDPDIPVLSRKQRRRKTRARLSVLTVVGEVLIIGGLGVFGYIPWQMWNTATVVPNQQVKLAAQDSAKWDAQAKRDPAPETPAQQSSDEIPVPPTPTKGKLFGVLYIPSIADTYAYRVGEGVEREQTLDRADSGIGHYPNTKMPGEIGNAAISGHRSGGIITPFHEIMKLRLGDPLFFETAEGWYTYRFRSMEYVLPTALDVLQPFPWGGEVAGNDRLLTITTCHPKNWGIDERVITYATFDSFTPRSAGPPRELAALNPNIKNGAA